MCAVGQPCPHLTFAQLRGLTEAVTRSGLWTGRRVLVTVEHRPGLHGTASGRVVRFPLAGAPLCTVAHELAHVATGYEHGLSWAAEFARLQGSILAAVDPARNVTGRGPTD